MDILEEITSNRVMIIAEIGNNHNGDFSKAIELIDLAVAAGADCVKFQMRHLDQVYREKSLRKSGEDLGTEYILDLLNRFELSVEEHIKISKYCNENGVIYFCTPWDLKSLKVLEEMGVALYKVASADLTNMPLIAELVKTSKPLILSTGMSTQEEVQITADYLKSQNASFALLHCNSTYPAPFHDINLRWLHDLRNIHSLVGYSGHERGVAVSIGAVALGARIIEKHFTLDRNMEGPDHAASLEFDDFRRMVEGIRQVESALGNGGSRQLSQGEMINRENLSKSLVASRNLQIGEVITDRDVLVKSPGQGLSPRYLQDLVGKTLHRNLNKEDYFYQSDLNVGVVKPRDYKFSRPWGIPVRYHDFQEFALKIEPDLYEFHLSYSDMDLSPNDYLSSTHNQDFVVHAPELFSGSHLMDLAAIDKEHREQSIFQTQRVIEITKDLKRFFPNTARPMIVANIGGFSMDAFINRDLVAARYQIFADSLGRLNLDGVELIPQTMAPFPWHFGGQRYQNLFVHPEEIVDWCKTLGLRMCFDISHSYLTCQNFGYDFYDFANVVGPITAHLHIGDARGLNGEGLQVGEGDIDFEKLSTILNVTCPKASFIPEIWQGHKNGGENFWIALEKLSGLV